MLEDDHVPGQAFEDGGADVVGVHHFDHGSPGHTRYVAEVIQNEHRCGQDQFLPRKTVSHRAGAWEPGQAEDKEG